MMRISHDCVSPEHRYNLVFDRVLGTNLFTKPIQTECRVFRTLQRTYGLNNGLPFGGDAASLNTSNVTGIAPDRTLRARPTLLRIGFHTHAWMERSDET